MSVTTWNIKPRAGKCMGCGRSFEPGQRGHSLLLAGGEAPERRDLCEACFGALSVGELRSLPGVWAFTVPKAVAGRGRTEPIRRETAEELLREKVAAGRAEDRAVIWVLAILLERSKKLVERQVSFSAEGRKLRLYEEKATGDLLTIEDPGLSEADLPAVQQQVAALFAPKPAEGTP